MKKVKALSAGLRTALFSIAALAAAAGAQSAAPESKDTASAEKAGGDAALLARGKLMYLRCRACHTLEEGGNHTAGPNLFGMFGSTAGEKEGFAFSAEFEESDIVWSAETLDAFLEKPQSFLPGNKMAFIGLPGPQDRKALIAYLLKETRPADEGG